MAEVERHIEMEISHIFDQKLISEPRRKYNENYFEEIELNIAFHNFVHNYKAAYEGKNTRKAQANVKTVSANDRKK